MAETSGIPERVAQAPSRRDLFKKTAQGVATIATVAAGIGVAAPVRAETPVPPTVVSTPEPPPPTPTLTAEQKDIRRRAGYPVDETPKPPAPVNVVSPAAVSGENPAVSKPAISTTETTTTTARPSNSSRGTERGLHPVALGGLAGVGLLGTALILSRKLRWFMFGKNEKGKNPLKEYLKGPLNESLFGHKVAEPKEAKKTKPKQQPEAEPEDDGFEDELEEDEVEEEDPDVDAEPDPTTGPTTGGGGTGTPPPATPPAGGVGTPP